jgi:hypothetical protein
VLNFVQCTYIHTNILTRREKYGGGYTETQRMERRKEETKGELKNSNFKT